MVGAVGAMLGHCEARTRHNLRRRSELQQVFGSRDGIGEMSLTYGDYAAKMVLRLNLWRDKGMNQLHFHKEGSIACR